MTNLTTECQMLFLNKNCYFQSFLTKGSKHNTKTTQNCLIHVQRTQMNRETHLKENLIK